MLLRPPQISSDFFNFHAGKFTSEASTLEGNGFHLGRVYDDACDEGFTMVSSRTGCEVVFALHHIERDFEGDLLFEDYISVTPKHRGIIARVFND